MTEQLWWSWERCNCLQVQQESAPLSKANYPFFIFLPLTTQAWKRIYFNKEESFDHTKPGRGPSALHRLLWTGSAELATWLVKTIQYRQLRYIKRHTKNKVDRQHIQCSFTEHTHTSQNFLGMLKFFYKCAFICTIYVACHILIHCCSEIFWSKISRTLNLRIEQYHSPIPFAEIITCNITIM